MSAWVTDTYVNAGPATILNLVQTRTYNTSCHLFLQKIASPATILNLIHHNFQPKKNLKGHELKGLQK